MAEGGEAVSEKARYLTGTNVKPSTAAEARKLVGRKFEYLRTQDIDKSGRGYIFPKKGVVTDVFRNYVEFDHSRDYISRRDIVEMVEIK